VCGDLELGFGERDRTFVLREELFTALDPAPEPSHDSRVMIPFPVTGGCLCGAIRYAYEGPIGPAAYCHCTDCRRVTGSAFNVSVRFERASLRIEKGEPKAFTKRADSGNLLTRSFCGECGSPLFTTSPAHPEHAFVKAGSLDEPTVVAPTAQSWVDSAVAWSAIAPGLPAFARGRVR
jgi:hypothetical protein